MPFCPNCRYEYTAGIRRCPDCGAELVERTEPEPNPEPIELVEIFSGDTLTAEILRGILSDKGIASILQPREPYAGVLGERAMPSYSAVMVSSFDAAHRAQAIEESIAMITELPANEQAVEE